jgi:hypothetical protein
MAEDAVVVAMEVAEPQQPAQADKAAVKGKGKMGVFPTTPHRWSLG